MHILRGIASLAGRICLSALFIWAVAGKLLDWNGTMQYMASKHMPLIEFFLPAAVVMQILGGLSLLLGYKARFGALVLIIFMIPACIIFHDFWNLEGMQRLSEQIIFMSQLGVLGGLLQIAAFGPGPYSLDNLIFFRRTE